MNKSVNSILGINRNIAMWDLVAIDNKFFGASGYNTAPTAAALGNDYFNKMNFKNNCIIQGPFMITEDTPNNPTIPKMVVSKSVVDLDNLDIVGYVVFFVNEKLLRCNF